MSLETRSVSHFEPCLVFKLKTYWCTVHDGSRSDRRIEIIKKSEQWVVGSSPVFDHDPTTFAKNIGCRQSNNKEP